jgi:hypothetical protein
MIAQMFRNETSPKDISEEDDDMTDLVEDAALGLIAKLATVPNGTQLIDEVFIKQCANLTGHDPVRFLRDLRDELVFSGGCADVIIKVISAVLKSYPEETFRERDARHEELKARC